MISKRLESHDGPRCPRRIDEVHRGAKQSGKGMIQCNPLLESPKEISVYIINSPTRRTHLSSVSASTQAQISTPVPPSFKPPHGLAPQLSASHLPVLNLKCNSRVFSCCKICPSDRGKYLKCCCSNELSEALLRKLNDANKEPGGKG